MEPVWNSQPGTVRPDRSRFGKQAESWSFWKVVGAVALGCWIGAMAYTATIALFTKATVEYQLQEFNAAMKKELAADQARQKQANQAAADRQRAADQAEANRRQQIQDQMNSARQEQSKRESAWQRYWQPSASCRANPNTEACANEHIQARRKFEVTYDAGLL